MNLNKNLKLAGMVAAILLAHESMAANEPAPIGTHPTAARVAPAEEPGPAAELVPAKPNSDADLWQRIRRGFVMNAMDSPMVQEHEQWYANRPDYIQRFVDRGSKYLYHVVEEVERRGMPTEVALLPIIESAFNPQAYSRAKAAGMWQFIPSTGKSFGLKQDWSADNRRDVLLSTNAALDYLQKLYGMFNSWELAFAAYNCGEGCVGRAIDRNARKGLPTDFQSLNLPAETRNYVPKLIAVKNIVLTPGSYGIELEAVENRPYFAKVQAPERIDVNLAARLAEMPAEEFAALNPAFTKPVASSGSGYFLVPAEKADAFRENLELYRSLNGPMVSWKNASAKRGEAVEAVAKRYGMSASYLRATNGPFMEKKGRFTQPVTFMVPMHHEAKIINATLDKKVALKTVTPAVTEPSSETAKPMPAVAIATAAMTTATVAAMAAAVTPATDDAPVAASAETPPSYRIRKGDTLFSVAKRFGLTVDQLKALNGLKNNGLQVGQELALVDGGSDSLAVAPQPSPALVRASVARPVSRFYTVRTGDTLTGIADKLGLELASLLRWNKLTARSVLRPGARLRTSG